VSLLIELTCCEFGRCKTKVLSNSIRGIRLADVITSDANSILATQLHFVLKGIIEVLLADRIMFLDTKASALCSSQQTTGSGIGNLGYQSRSERRQDLATYRVGKLV